MLGCVFPSDESLGYSQSPATRAKKYVESLTAFLTVIINARPAVICIAGLIVARDGRGAAYPVGFSRIR